MRKFVISSFLMALIVTAGCDGLKSDSNQPEFNDKNQDKIKVVIKDWVKLDGKVFGNPSPTMYIPPIMSLDKKWLYLATSGYAGNLVALDIGDEFSASVNDATKWTKLTWNVPSFSDIAGKARFSDVGQTSTLNPTVDGLLIAWQDTSGAGEHGALHVKGNTLVQAWKSATHIVGFVINHKITNFFTVMKNGAAVPYILASSIGNGGQSKLFTDTKLENATFPTSPAFGIGASKYSMAQFAQNETKAFLVSYAGISVLDVADAGTNTPFSAVAENTPLFGSNEWNMGDPMTQNFNVRDIVVANDKLYIGLACPHDFQGGVVIYDIANNKLIPPKKAIWNRVDVRDFAVDKDGKVWAVTAKELIEVKDNGTMGDKFNAAMVAAGQAVISAENPTTGYRGEMPADNIFGALFIDNSLVLVADKAAYVMIERTVDVE